MVADDLVTVVMGERWVAAIPILQVMCLVLPFRAPMRTMGATLDGLGRPEVALRQAATRALCVPVGVSIGASFGILGATWGWAAASIVAMAINLRRGLPVVGAHFQQVVGVMAPTFAVGVAMVIVVLAAQTSVIAGLEPWQRLLASVAIGVGVYGGGTVLANRALLERYRRLLRSRGLEDGEEAAAG